MRQISFKTVVMNFRIKAVQKYMFRDVYKNTDSHFVSTVLLYIMIIIDNNVTSQQ